jgi:ligand-binding sensor domain-containing protein/AraC-like DNA-binding protein
MKQKHILIILLILNFLRGYAQQTEFFDEKNGVSGNLIDKIFQDKSGNVYFTGKSGFIKFDGTEFSTPLKKNSLNNIQPWVKSICFADGKTFFGTTRGLILHDDLSEKDTLLRLYVRDSVITEGYISSMVRSKSPDALIVTVSGDGLTAIDAKTGETIIPLSKQLDSLCANVRPGNLFIDSKNCLWTFASEGTFRKINLDNLTREDLETSFANKEPLIVTSAAEIPETSDMVFGTVHHGIIKYERETGKFFSVKTASKEISGRINTILCLRNSYDGSRILVGSEDFGLLHYNHVTGELKPTTLKNNRINLNNCKIHDIFQDRYGNVWACVFQKGLLLAARKSDLFSVIELDGNSCPVTAIIGKDDGTVYAGTDGSGVFVISPDGSQKTFTAENSPLPNNSVMSMSLDKDQNLWVATFAGGLSKISADKKKLENFSLDADFQRIPCMFYDKKRNRLLLGTLGAGTVILDFETSPVKIQKIDFPQYVSNIFEDSADRFYINNYQTDSTLTQKMRQIGSKKEVFINAAEEDSNGNIWFGGENYLWKYNPKTDSVEIVEHNDFAGFVQTMFFDGYGCLWYGTQDRLVRYDVKNGDFVAFNAQDGLFGTEFSPHGVWKKNEGKFLVGNSGGITVITPPETMPELSTDGELYFSSLTIAGKQVSGFNCLTKHIEIEYDKNMFSVKLRIPEFSNFHRLKFRYRLKGFSNEFYYIPEGEPQISFTNLPFGNYVLEAQAFFDEKDLQKPSCSLEITVLPPWYRTFWAYCVYIIIAVLLYFGVLSYKKNSESLRRQKIENNKMELRLENFKNKLLAGLQPEKSTKTDEVSSDLKLLRKIMDSVNKHIFESDFGVNELSREIGISRVHLHRKLKELLNITPLNLIRAVKMKNAAMLLVENGLSPSEAAFKLGFSSHSYFSSYFRDYFSMPPTEFATKFSQKENRDEYEKIINKDLKPKQEM